MSGAILSKLLTEARTKLNHVIQWQGTSTRASFTPMFDRLRVEDVNAALFADLRARNANPKIATVVPPVKYDPAQDALKIYNDGMRNRVIGPW